MRVINLTDKELTTTQKNRYFFDLPPRDRAKLLEYLDFDKKEIKYDTIYARSQIIAQIADKTGASFAYIDCPLWMAFPLQEALLSKLITPIIKIGPNQYLGL